MALPSQGRYLSALGGEQGTARRMGTAYESRARNFDPYESAQRQNEATLASFFEQYGDDFRDLRGSQVGSGRLNTGFATQDEGDLERRFMDRTGRALAQNSLQASGLELSNINSMGSYAGQARGRYLDLLSGQLDREQMEANARRDRGSGLWGGIGSLLGGVGGFLVGGPAGAAVGAGVGRSVGSGVGGY